MLSHKTIRRFEEFTFVMPALILFLAFVVYPFFSGFPLSFYKWDGMSPQKTFVGLNNYLRFFQDRNVGNAVKNTLVFTILSAILTPNGHLLSQPRQPTHADAVVPSAS